MKKPSNEEVSKLTSLFASLWLFAVVLVYIIIQIERSNINIRAWLSTMSGFLR